MVQTGAGCDVTSFAPVEQQIPHYPGRRVGPPPGLPRWSSRFPTTPAAASAPTGLASVERQIPYYPAAAPEPATRSLLGLGGWC